jgi:hypothetical protein
VKRIAYADTVFVTDDGVADALMAYARTLALVSAADVVQVPGLDSSGVLRTFELLVGPASQMISSDVDDEPVAMAAEEAVEDLSQRRSKRLPPAEDVVLAGLPADDPEATDLNDPEPPQ